MCESLYCAVRRREGGNIIVEEEVEEVLVGEEMMLTAINSCLRTAIVWASNWTSKVQPASASVLLLLHPGTSYIIIINTCTLCFLDLTLTLLQGCLKQDTINIHQLQRNEAGTDSLYIMEQSGLTCHDGLQPC